VKWNCREKMPCTIPKHKLFSAFPLRPLRLCGENLRFNCGFKDYLHLFAARKAGAVEFHTLNYRDFQAFQRPGDPQIVDAAK
jgi:hypothetical protein